MRDGAIRPPRRLFGMASGYYYFFLAFRLSDARRHANTQKVHESAIEYGKV